MRVIPMFALAAIAWPVLIILYLWSKETDDAAQ